jgi:hypothetical protein
MFITVANEEKKDSDQGNVTESHNQEHDIISGTSHVSYFQLNIKYVL